MGGHVRNVHSANRGLSPGARYQIVSTFAIVLVVVAAAQLMKVLRHDDPPQLFYGALYGETLDDYQGILAIGHNSGNRVSSSEAALGYQADVIEIDVRSIRGELRVAHSPPPQILGSLVSPAPYLGSVWPTASGAHAVNLDLKSSSDAFLDKLFAFLESQEEYDTSVILTSRSVYALERARAEYPDAVRILSIAGPGRLQALRDDPQALGVIDGVSVAETALDEETAMWLEEHGVLTFVWVVNELETLNRLATWGVDGIITDNLAIVELLTWDREEGDNPVERILRPANEPPPHRAGFPPE